MKMKESLWDLLERLDEQAGQFNVHLSEANRYFDMAAKKTKTVLERQEKELHTTIAKVKSALKSFSKQKDKNNGSEK
jgi:hypothetical protein